MKKSIWLAGLLAAMVSCQDDTGTDNPESGVSVAFNGTVLTDAQGTWDRVRAGLYGRTGNDISLGSNVPYDLRNESGASLQPVGQETIAWPVEEGTGDGSFYAYYPFREDNSNPKAVLFSLDELQSYGAGINVPVIFNQAEPVTASRGEKVGLEFRNVLSTIRISLRGDGLTVKKLRLETDGTPLGGKFAKDITQPYDRGLELLEPVTGMTVSPGNPVEVAGTPVWFAVPVIPGVYDPGMIKITVTDQENQPYTAALSAQALDCRPDAACTVSLKFEGGQLVSDADTPPVPDPEPDPDPKPDPDPDPEPAPSLLFHEHFGTASSADVVSYNGWERGGAGGAGVRYAYEGTTDGPVRNKVPSGGYEGASGGANLYTASGGVFTLAGIDLCGARTAGLSLGITTPSDHLRAEYSFDGNKWYGFTLDDASYKESDGKWGKVTFHDVATDGQSNIDMRLTLLRPGRIDDIALYADGGGAVVPPAGKLSVDKSLVADLPADRDGEFAFHINANVSWKLNADAQWVLPYTHTGDGPATVTCAYKANGGDARTCTITIEGEGVAPVTVKVTQLAADGGGVDPDPDVPVEVAGWIELPKVATDAQTQFVTHNVTLGGKKVRSYSMLYDKKEHIAYWVAYPMHECYTKKNVKRTDAWQYDPIIPRGDQVNLSSSYGGYSRGHQIASSDRVASREMNEQTFFYTNMTPQVQSFNGAIWVKLENKVRTWIPSDTLYVVTGAVLQTVGGNERVSYVKDTAIPNYYYKVMMKRKGAGFTAIGFWFEHKANNENLTTKYARSVDQIEELTGYDFFANVPRELQDRAEASYNASDWGGL